MHWSKTNKREEIIAKVVKTLRSDYWKGKKRNPEIIKKLNEGRQKWIKENPKEYKKSEEKRIAKTKQNVGEKNHKWKGDKAGKLAIHKWMERHFGKSQICEFCGEFIENTFNIHWANKDGRYLRERDNWWRLCVWCHIKHDKTSIEYQMGYKSRL